jgi:UDP-N-acetylglucosamine--N-acetylmuramyl-(pentapeptide) pyrophosphoryl-undecaprenol N-acetylglucosamine transferase
VKILIAGGGTAGHVFPALALARRLRDAGEEVRFVGTARGQEATLVPEAGFPLSQIDARPFVRKLSVEALAGPVSAVRSIAASRPLVDGAEVVVGMGGYVSVPVGLAAVRSDRPLVLHEQNAVPGLANRLLSRRARRVALSLPEAARRLPRSARTVVTGNPVRDEVVAVPANRVALRQEALAELHLEAGRRTVVVFGGSQGALHLNRAIEASVARLAGRADLQVLVLTGPRHVGDVRRALPRVEPLTVRAIGFVERMELVYAIADLVVARAGATTVAELTVCGVPSILVPYPYATGRHQEANARTLQQVGAAAVMLDDAIDGGALVAEIERLLADVNGLRTMAERAAAWARPDAAEALAAVVREAGAR